MKGYLLKDVCEFPTNNIQLKKQQKQIQCKFKFEKDIKKYVVRTYIRGALNNFQSAGILITMYFAWKVGIELEFREGISLDVIAKSLDIRVVYN